MLKHLFDNLLTRRAGPGRAREDAVNHYQAGNLEAAEIGFREAIRADPGESQHWANLAATLLRRQNHSAALPVLVQLAEMRPADPATHNDLGLCHARLQEQDEAIACFRRALVLRPDYAVAQANLVNACMDSCDWPAVAAWREHFLARRTQVAPAEWASWLSPFSALTLCPGPLVRELAGIHAARIAEAAARLPPLAHPTDRRRAGRLRIGYVSSDFYAHATMHLTFGLYAAHDRARFEVFGYSIGRSDNSPYRRQVETTCDHFVDLQHADAHAIATRIAADGIDVLVDLKGYTANSRPEIFALRPAPVQVNYLGYPGTSAAPWMDYYVTDPVATGPDGESEFSEALAWLPDSYQVNDQNQPIAAQAPTRAEQGLPPSGFVFCSFNAVRKIEPVMFATWMNILKAVPQSVLWLLGENASAMRHLRQAAARQDVAPERLVFAAKLDKPAHLARHRLADLFLDTLLYNAHTTGSDALWAGLPLLTCPGQNFASRVGASLLHAAGLPELAVGTLEAYQAMAIRLAREPVFLADFRERLARGRLACPLFDTRRYVRHLETAFLTMHETAARGAPPASFRVPPLS